LGEIQCDECHHIVSHAERYFAIDGEDDVEAEKRRTAYYCVECALQKGYAYYKEDKDERILTVFPEPKY
jgi:hypothetical protein